LEQRDGAVNPLDEPRAFAQRSDRISDTAVGRPDIHLVLILWVLENGIAQSKQLHQPGVHVQILLAFEEEGVSEIGKKN
jgi:hypothetical protein